jgi:hypothetical protein
MMGPSGAHAIDTLDDPRRHLQWAIELEHATIPPYLCALYSLDPDRNPEAAQVIRTVFTEEMLHLALAAKPAQRGGLTPTRHARPAVGLPASVAARRPVIAHSPGPASRNFGSGDGTAPATCRKRPDR